MTAEHKSHGHGHSHGAAAVSAGRRHMRPLVIAFALTGCYMVVELAVGLSIGSLALISDAAHMGTDVLGLGMALIAIMLAARKAGGRRTFGTYRVEVLAALANGVLLFGVAAYVLVEAIRRFGDPPEIPGLPLMITALIGLAINLISFRLLSAGAKESVNVKGASLEVLGDLIGSVGVICAAVILYLTGWAYIDPLIGVAVGLFILPRTWVLMKQAISILIEASPPHLSLDAIRADIAALAGVVDVHDLHVWTLTSGVEAASVHVLVEQSPQRDDVPERVRSLLAERYGISHSTVQPELRPSPLCEEATF